MAHWVYVTIRGTDDTFVGPSGTQEEAEQQLRDIRETLGSARSPSLPWMAVLGKDILSARVMSDDDIGIG